MMQSLFVCISDVKISRLINNSTERVALVAPGIGMRTADALIAARHRLGEHCVFVVVDCDEEVFRLGYGSFEALQKVAESGQPVGQSSGLRIGVLVCDQVAWSFAPTALYVESEVHSNETPNALVLRAEDVERILARVIPKKLRDVILKPDDVPPVLRALKDSLSGMLPNAEALDRELSTLCYRAIKASFEAHQQESPGVPFTLQKMLKHFVEEFGMKMLMEVRPYIEHSWERLSHREEGDVEEADFDAVFDALKRKKGWI